MSDILRDKYDTFTFDSYNIEYTDNGINITYNYSISDFHFKPNVFINSKYINTKINKNFFENLIFNFGIINSINYYKLTCAKKMIINAGYLSNEQKSFFKKLFYNGLGEFMFVNKLDIPYDEFLNIETFGKKIDFEDIEYELNGNLIPVGGGKDSIVTLETLRGLDNVCFLYKRNIYPDDLAALNCIKLSNNDFVSFDVTLDKLMLDLNKEGFYNGHIPFSSNLAFASIIMAYLNNKKYVVLSNEASANESNIKGSSINHQYSKSFEFEQDFRNYSLKYLSKKIEYFSLLRCLNEFQIVKKFLNYPLYLEVFRSCNRGSKTNTWCGTCSKCLYVYIMLYPFIDDDKLIKIFGNNMLDNFENKDMFEGLILEDKNKPFECVGTKEEINYALTLGLDKSNKLPYLLKLYKDKHYDKNKKYNIENYFNKNNFIPNEYLKRIGSDLIEK